MIDADVLSNRRRYRRRVGVEMWQSQIRKGSLDLAVLASLWDGPLDRPQICGRLERTAGINLVQGVLYPLLRRLRKAGWIETAWVEVEAGHPRQLFHLTDGGRRSAMELSWRWTLFADGMNRMVGMLSRTEPDMSKHGFFDND
jgi:PadR family transcriptional regulator, regulatory protein PadR